MSFRQLLAQFCNYQEMARQQLINFGIDYKQQYHPDLSPLGWHLGHCVYTESYWIREKLLETENISDDISGLYNPFISEKSLRSESLPPLNELLEWAVEMQSLNINLLNATRHQYGIHELMQNNFLLHFLIQHYAQHLETMRMIIAQSSLKNTSHPESEPIIPMENNLLTKTLITGDYQIGQQQNYLPYDNEYIRHSVNINQVELDNIPVSNGNYIRFIESGGYQNRDYWSDDSWVWRSKNNIQSPAFWYQDNNQNWNTLINLDKSIRISEQPVCGISHYEASAFAKWTGKRLLHEQEWEAADKQNLLDQKGLVWEWCHNTFYPYTGFKPWPYEGYSVPYFDNQHYTLKGGSIFTEPVIKRSSFRNYYLPDKRFLLAGIRLAH